MRGASAAEEVLKREKSDELTVLVVWEPILASDWSRPTRPVLGRISDQRLDFGWTIEAVVLNNVFAVVEANFAECKLAEFADGVRFAAGNYKVVRLLMLKHQVHCADVILGVTPIAARDKIAKS